MAVRMPARPATAAAPGTRLPPRLGGGLPFLGHAVALRRAPLTLLRRGFDRHGEIFRFTVLGRTFVLFAGPEAHAAYFRAADDHLSQKDVYQFTIPIFGDGIAYDAPPDLMAEQVRFLHPGLREERMQTYVGLAYEEVGRYLDAAWGDEGTVDLPAATNDVTVNIACRCLLGDEVRRELHQDFGRLYHDLQGGISLIGFFAPGLPIPAHVRRDRARRGVVRLIGGILAERRRTGRRAEDLMQTLMDSRYADGRSLTDDEITGILLTALFAGQHTSGVLAAWTGVELLGHPGFLPPILAEIEASYAGGGARPTLAALRRQEALERAIREAERLHPPLIILVRKVLRDFRYKGFTIPAGAMAMVSPALSHRLPAVFPEPERYDPDRFAASGPNARVEPFTMVTFGGGRHRCIGLHFAYMQIEVLWTVLLARFELELATPPPEPDYGSWVTGPRPPCRIRYRRRRRPLGGL